jgi:transcriptional regulator with XRE-family HTH domain
MTDWTELRARRMAEPGAAQEYEAARLAHYVGCAVRGLREHNGCSQTRLAHAAGMTQTAIARFEAGGTPPTTALLEQLIRALGAVTNLDHLEVLDELRHRTSDQALIDSADFQESLAQMRRGEGRVLYPLPAREPGD